VYVINLPDVTTKSSYVTAQDLTGSPGPWEFVLCSVLLCYTVVTDSFIV